MLTRDLKDRRIGLVTITGVRMSRDLRHARVFVSAMGDKNQKSGSVDALNHAAGWIRHELGQRLRLKYLPDLVFQIDSSQEYGERIDKLTETRGYDHNYVLSGSYGSAVLAARVYEPDSGRLMEVYTTEPGVQLYTANGMRNVTGKQGKVYNRHGGFCLETQHFPDSPNKPHFPSTILRPGQQYKTTTTFKFSTK